MTTRRLSRALRWILLVGGLFTCCSCFPKRTDLQAPSCDGSRWAIAQALTFPTQPNWVSVEYAWWSSRRDEAGVRCGDATDPVACDAAIQALERTGLRPNIIVQHGDEVWKIEAEQIANAIAPIDNPDEALLVARAAGYGYRICETSDPEGARALDGGWEIVLRGGYCDVTCYPHLIPTTYDEYYYRYWMRMDADGLLEEIARKRIFSGVCEDSCICHDCSY